MLLNQWYLIGPDEDLPKGTIHPLRILGRDIVVWRTPNGEVTALEDRCCHRNVPLSQGFLKKDCIVCAYHGWQFDPSGACVLIPSGGDDGKIPQTAFVRSYPVLLQNRLLWIFVGDKEPSHKPPVIPEMDQWDFVAREYTFEADLESAAESLLDPYHITFAHRDSIKTLMGVIEDIPADFHVTVTNDGLLGEYRRANRGSWYEKRYFGHEEHIQIRYRFFYPNLSRLEVIFKERTLLILEHIMQVDDHTVSMTQITLWKNIFHPFRLFARSFMRRISHKIVCEDIALLSAQSKVLREQIAKEGRIREVSVKGDAISLAFRKFWRQKLHPASSTPTTAELAPSSASTLSSPTPDGHNDAKDP